MNTAPSLRRAAHLLVAGLTLVLVGCGSFKPKAPDEFAAYDRGMVFKGPLRAVSPDGVLFTVRTEKNKPKADLAFWREAMETRLQQAGYRIVSDSACAMQGAEGVLLQTAAPVGQQDYFYWVAFSLSPNGKKILVAEAAGESKRFLAKRDAVRKAIAESGF
jgi:hypothetical protein